MLVKGATRAYELIIFVFVALIEPYHLNEYHEACETYFKYTL